MERERHRTRVVARATAIAVMLAAIVGLAGCGAAGSSSGSGDPIHLGAIMTKTGSPYSFGPVGIQAMTEAVYNQVNASGGINGHKISYTVVDDTNSPQGAAEAARQLTEQDGVVMLTGGASYVSCSANGSLYKADHIYDLEAIFTDNHCEMSPNIAATNPGPNVSQTLMLQYAYSKLHLTRLCNLQQANPNNPYQEQSVSQFEKLTGDKLVLADFSIPDTVSDFTPYLIRVRAAHCQAVFVDGGPTAASISQEMTAQKMTNVVVLTTGGTYQPSLGQALGKFPVEWYVASEFNPISTSVPGMAQYLALAKKNNIPLNPFTQGAYLAATYTVDVLKTIKGPITRSSVTTALQNMKPIQTVFTGTPFKFGNASDHVANKSIKIAKLVKGTWQIVTPSFVSLP